MWKKIKIHVQSKVFLFLGIQDDDDDNNDNNNDNNNK
jgi:hypothetical protein